MSKVKTKEVGFYSDLAHGHLTPPLWACVAPCVHHAGTERPAPFMVARKQLEVKRRTGALVTPQMGRWGHAAS